MRRGPALVAFLVWTAAAGVAAADTWVAPRVHAVGVDPETAATFEFLLVQEIEHHLDGTLVRAPESAETRPCSEPTCAGRRARRLGADGAFLALLGALGDKYVATLQRVDASGRVVWSRQLSARHAEDLDGVAGRLAAALGEDSPARTPLDSVPALNPPIHRGWTVQGPRVGSVHPAGDSYAGAARLTSLAYTWRYQTSSYNVEVVPALGLAWGGDLGQDGGKARDWTLLDLYVSWTPARGDLAPYVGLGLGLHALRLEREGYGAPFTGRRDESSTGIALAAGCGLLLFRTYDFQLALDLRYVHFTHDFETLGGGGAQGLALTFGIQHR